MNKQLFLYPAVLSLSALLLAGSAMAEPQRGKGGGPGHHGPKGAEQQLARLDRALDLSDEQAAQLLELLQATDAERQALHERVMAEFRPDFCALMQETDAEILAVLTPEQAASFEQLNEERRQRKDGGSTRRMGYFDCDAAGDDA